MYIYYLSFNLILSLISLPFYLNNLFTFISNQLLFNKKNRTKKLRASLY